MTRRRGILWGVLAAVAVLGGGFLVHQAQEDDAPQKKSVAPTAARHAATPDELAELRGSLDAEKISDAFQRCMAYPNPAEFSWDPKIVEAQCQYWKQRPPNYKDLIAAIQQNHPQVLDTFLDADLQGTFQAGQHGFLVARFRRMFQDSSKAQGALMDQWVGEDPASAHALAARGLHFVERAFAARGGDSARNTSRDQFARMGEFAEIARGDLEAAVQRNPRHIAAYHGLLKVAQLQSDQELLASASKAALALDPADQEIYADLLDILEPKWGGSLEQMRAVAAEASKYADKNPLLHMTAARIACYQAERLVCAGCSGADTLKQHARQALELQRAAEHDGPAACVLNDSEYTAQEAGDDLWLVRNYSQSYRFLGGNKTILNRALLLQRLGKADWALEGIDRLLQEWPRYVDAHVHRGYVLMAEHRAREAQQAFAAAYAIDPNNWDATRNLVGAYSDLLKEPAKAREIVDRMMAETPRNPRVWLLEASLHKGGEEAKCRDALKKYLELVDPETEDSVDKYNIEKATKRVAELDRMLGR